MAGEVGVNIATLHYYFPTKEGLIRAVLDHAMNRFRTTLAPHGSSSEQLRNYLREARTVLIEEPELGAVMAELALRSVRDESIGSIMNEVFDEWHVTVRGLLRRAVKEGGLRVEIDSDGVSALIIATLTSMTLPVMADEERGDRALRQLETWLGIAPKRGRRESSN